MVDVNGCIAVGMEFGTYRGELAVLRSADAFAEFMKDRQGRLSFSLTIIDED